MSDYRRDFGHLSREVYWTVPRVFLWGLFGFVLLGLFAWIGSVLLAPTKVFDPNNIKANYASSATSSFSTRAGSPSSTRRWWAR